MVDAAETLYHGRDDVLSIADERRPKSRREAVPAHSNGQKAESVIKHFSVHADIPASDYDLACFCRRRLASSVGRCSLLFCVAQSAVIDQSSSRLLSWVLRSLPGKTACCSLRQKELPFVPAYCYQFTTSGEVTEHCTGREHTLSLSTTVACLSVPPRERGERERDTKKNLRVVGHLDESDLICLPRKKHSKGVQIASTDFTAGAEAPRRFLPIDIARKMPGFSLFLPAIEPRCVSHCSVIDRTRQLLRGSTINLLDECKTKGIHFARKHAGFPDNTRRTAANRPSGVCSIERGGSKSVWIHATTRNPTLPSRTSLTAVVSNSGPHRRLALREKRKRTVAASLFRSAYEDAKRHSVAPKKRNATRHESSGKSVWLNRSRLLHALATKNGLLLFF